MQQATSCLSSCLNSVDKLNAVSVFFCQRDVTEFRHVLASRFTLAVVFLECSRVVSRVQQATSCLSSCLNSVDNEIQLVILCQRDVTEFKHVFASRFALAAVFAECYHLEGSTSRARA